MYTVRIIVTKLLFAFSLLFLLGTPSASGVTLQLNAPECCEPGFDCQISWTVDNSGPDVFTKANFALMDYSFGQFNIIHIIASDVDVINSNSLTWHVPVDNLFEQQYFIGAFAIGAGYTTYSEHFWIMNDYHLGTNWANT